MRYRKKPVVIDAMQFDGTVESADAIMEWNAPYQPPPSRITFTPSIPALNVQTLEGLMRADVGDYIIRGVRGEFYPCKPDIFALTYEPVPDPPTPETEPPA
jgi:hypothetical protein